MNYLLKMSIALGIATFFFSGNARAHFGAIIPSDDIVSGKDPRTLQVDVKFIHPMEKHYMEMAKPKQFGVLLNGKKNDLVGTLLSLKGKSEDQVKDYTFWRTNYTIKRPGDYIFYLEPTPYWEPAEDLYIVHYTKVCVNVFGLEQGWDVPVGLETEIVPLTRPYGLWTGNLFTGQVLLKGKPVANAEVEVEYLNDSPGNPSTVVPPSDPFVTQAVKADDNGVFSYAMPREGWWGFSALSEASWKMQHEGQEKGVEIGAVFWVRTHDMK